MTFYQQLALICIASACNIIISMWLFRWRKHETIPQDVTALKIAFDAYKQITDRLIEEAEERSKDIAIVQLQMGRDMVGLRGQMKYLQGIINGKFWKRADDVEDAP